MAWIDAHIHIWTSDVDSYPLAGEQTAADLDPPDFTPEMYLRHARPSGIEKVVVVQTGYHQFDNSYATDAIRRFPGVFSVIGIVDEMKENVQEDMEALKAQGVRGFRIGVDYDGPQWDRLFEAAARTGQAMCPITHPVGAPAIKEIAAKHPDTTVVVDHMTRVGEMDPINDEHIGQLTDIATLPNTHVKISRLHALGGWAAPRRPHPHDWAHHRCLRAGAVHVGERLPVPGRQGNDGGLDLRRPRQARPLRVRPRPDPAWHGRAAVLQLTFVTERRASASSRGRAQGSRKSSLRVSLQARGRTCP